MHSEINHIFKNTLKTALQKTNKAMCPGDENLFRLKGLHCLKILGFRTNIWEVPKGIKEQFDRNKMDIYRSWKETMWTGFMEAIRTVRHRKY